MSPRTRLRTVLQTDREARLEEGVWRIRCLHCRHALHLAQTGEPLDGGTLEHIVPRSWFGRRAAAHLTANLHGPDDPRNLALACARCNQQKGKGPDARGPEDARAQEIVSALLEQRARRYLTPPPLPARRHGSA